MPAYVPDLQWTCPFTVLYPVTCCLEMWPYKANLTHSTSLSRLLYISPLLQWTNAVYRPYVGPTLGKIVKFASQFFSLKTSFVTTLFTLVYGFQIKSMNNNKSKQLGSKIGKQPLPNFLLVQRHTNIVPLIIPKENRSREAMGSQCSSSLPDSTSYLQLAIPEKQVTSWARHTMNIEKWSWIS